MAAHKVAKLGMVRTFQLTKSLTKMSVIENMKLGATGQSGENMWRGLIPFLWRSQENAIEERAMELLARFKLGRRRSTTPARSPAASASCREMARALMVSPELVMLDEPMAASTRR